MGLNIHLSNKRRSGGIKSKIGAAIFALLFCIPFAGFGLFATGWIIKDVGTWVIMKTWEPTEARLHNVHLDSSYDSDNGTTYKVKASYEYRYAGSYYQGDRVGISTDMSDNIGSYHEDKADELKAAQRSGGVITVYVNPSDPSEAVIDRSMRWGLLAFKSIFALLFTPIGLGVGYAMFIRKPTEISVEEAEKMDNPWTAKKEWAPEGITSESKLTMYVAWGFCLFWNIISVPTAVMVTKDLIDGKADPLAAMVYLFPLVGLGLLFWAIKSTAEWARFGRIPLVLDPFPGSIGGHVGGTMELPLSHVQDQVFEVMLTQYHSYIVRTSDGNSRRNEVKWQEKAVAHTESGFSGTKLTFRFDVPDYLPESGDHLDETTYDYWAVRVTAKMKGADFNREYKIPVFKTVEKSRSISDRVIEDIERIAEKHHSAEVYKIAQISDTASGGLRIFYPMFRNFWVNVMGMVFTGFFFVGGIVMLGREDVPPALGWGFTGLGGLIFLLGTCRLLSSQETVFDYDAMRLTKRLLGIPRKRLQIRIEDIKELIKRKGQNTQSFNQEVQCYDVYVMSKFGKKIKIAHEVRGGRVADELIEMIEEKIGMKKDEPTENPIEGADYNTDFTKKF